MRQLNRTLVPAGLLAVLSLSCATLNLEPRATPDQVNRAFVRAERKAERHAQRRLGERPHRVHVLLYDGSDRDLVQISVPLWMVRMALRFAERQEEVEIEGVNLDWREVLEQGAGIYLEVSEAEERLLVWLE